MAAGEVLGQAVVEVLSDTSKFMTPEDAQKINRAGRDIAEGLAAAFASVKVFQFGQDAFKEFEQAEKAIKQTEAVLRSTGSAAGVTAENVADLTEALEKKQVVDDNAIRTGANLLLTFTNIRNAAGENNDIFDQTTEMMVDMTAAMNGGVVTQEGMKASAIQLGKALNDPIIGMSALAEVGVSWTAQQREQITALMESGDLMGAQKVILGELSREFSGSAAAQATSSDKAKIAYENLREELGAQLVPAVNTVMDATTGLLGLWEEIPASLQQAIVYVGMFSGGMYATTKVVDGVKAALQTYHQIVGLVEKATAAARVAHVANAGAATTEAAATEVLAAAQTHQAATGAAATASMAPMLPILAAVAAAAAVAGGAYLLFRDRTSAAEKAQKDMATALSDTTTNLYKGADAMAQYIETQSRFKTRNQLDDLDRLGMSYQRLDELMRAGSSGRQQFEQEMLSHGEVVVGVTERMGNYYDAQGNLIDRDKVMKLSTGELVSGNVDLLKSFVSTQQGMEANARTKLENIRRNEKLTDTEKEQLAALIASGDKLADYEGLWEAVSKRLGEADAATKGVTESTTAVGTATSMATNPIVLYVQSLKNVPSAADAAAKAHADMKAAISSNNDAIDRKYFGTTDAIEKFNAKFKETSSASGGAKRDVEKDARDMAKAIADVTSAEDELADAIERQQLIAAGPDANRIKIAEIDARRAKRELADATDAQAEAAQRLLDAQKDATPVNVARAKEAADRAVAAADRDIERATLAIKKAQDELNKALEEGDPEKILEAKLDLADANDALFKATGDAAKAHEGLQTAEELQAEASKKVEVEARKLEAAQDDSTVAADELKAKEKELLDARTSNLVGSPEMIQAAKDVKEAQEKLEEAHQRVKDLEKEIADSRTGGASAQGSLSAWEASVKLRGGVKELVDEITENGIPAIEDQNAVLDTSRQRMEAIAKTMSPEEADKLRRWYDEWEEKTRTTWSNQKSDFETKWGSIQKELADMAVDIANGKYNGEITYEGKFVYDEAAWQAKFNRMNADWERTTQTDLNGNGIIGAATGARGLTGWAWVGERGPELAYFRQPTDIYPHQQSVAMAAGGVGGSSFTFNVSVGSMSGSAEDAYRVGRTIAMTAYRAMSSSSFAISARKGTGR